MKRLPAWGAVEITVESLSAHRAAEKLARAGICVLSAENPRKNVVVLRVAARDRKKTFAILRGTCYNIKNVRNRGLARVREVASRAAGLVVGAALFAAIVFSAESRILRVEIVGSGAYYEAEIRAILAEEGISSFAPLGCETGSATARILSLPRVEFCSFKRQGGILTVEVECAEELSPRPAEPLLAPCDGVLEELVVLRGTPLAEVGSEVHAGQQLVVFAESGGSGRRGYVIARATVAAPVSKEYALQREEASLQASLDFPELSDVRMTQTEKGWLVEGVARYIAACGLG